jgi:phosphatidylinositol 3-kinase
MLYLLQLVQALKFDAAPAYSSRARSKQSRQAEARGMQTLEEFLIERSVKSPVLGNHLYWYLMCEMEDEGAGKLFRKVAFNFMTKIEAVRLLLL